MEFLIKKKDFTKALMVLFSRESEKANKSLEDYKKITKRRRRRMKKIKIKKKKKKKERESESKARS